MTIEKAQLLFQQRKLQVSAILSHPHLPSNTASSPLQRQWSSFDISPFGHILKYSPWLVLGLFVAYVVLRMVRFVRHRRFYVDLVCFLHELGSICLHINSAVSIARPALGKSASPGRTDEAIPAKCLSTCYDCRYNQRLWISRSLLSGQLSICGPMVFIIDPSVEIQTQRFLRHPVAKKYLRGLVGAKGLFSTEGAEWQAQRSWFSPAFPYQMSQRLLLEWPRRRLYSKRS